MRTIARRLVGFPGPSAVSFAEGYLRAGNGTVEQACRQGCIYDGADTIWWRFVRRKMKANNAVRGAAEPRTLDGLVGNSGVPK